ncbi:hypothetical protein [Rhizobium sullae]|uniref:Uncharacterized protein n=1 Tax=Rhizobium sullae TaxID=50338 RepID=A0A2N0DCX8_RHISU|nr:hypothetical protein [Rhizobium sullae]PKA43953.1 hypothetical protein CWR43_06470 [Rhizobium sullae]UWU14192.1 hypothetical protein N2599_19085 [Rhizobium sullae]
MNPAFRHPLRFNASTSVVKEKADIAANWLRSVEPQIGSRSGNFKAQSPDSSVQAAFMQDVL